MSVKKIVDKDLARKIISTIRSSCTQVAIVVVVGMRGDDVLLKTKPPDVTGLSSGTTRI